MKAVEKGRKKLEDKKKSERKKGSANQGKHTILIVYFFS